MRDTVSRPNSRSLESSFEKDFLGTVRTPNNAKLNVRKGADSNAEIVERLSNGDRVSVMNIGNRSWYKIQTCSGVIGYCMRSYIAEE